MADQVIGRAVIEVIPDLKKFGAETKAQVKSSVSGVSETFQKPYKDANENIRKDYDKTTQHVAKKTGGLAQLIKKSLGPAITAFSVMGAVGIAKGTINTFTDTAAEVGKLQRVAGGTAEEVSRLRFAATQSGVAVPAFTNSVKLLSKNLVGTEGNAKKTAAMTKLLGFQFQDAHGKTKPMATLLPQIAETFKNMPNGPAKTAAALKLFGRGGTDMLPFLNKGAAGLKALGEQSDKVGATMSGKNLAKLGAYRKEQRTFAATMLGLKLSVGGALLSGLTNVSKAINGFVEDMRSGNGIAGTFADVLGKAGDALQAAFGFAKEHTGTMKVLLGLIVSVVAITKAYNAVLAIQTALQSAGGLVGYIKNIKVVAAVTKLWAAVQWVLNASFAPLLLVPLAIAAIVFAFIYAYKHSEAFRKIIDAVGNALKGAFLAALHAVIGAFHAVVGAAVAVGAAVMVAFHAVGAAFGWVVGIVRTVITALVAAFQSVVTFLAPIWARIYPILALPFYIAAALIKGVIADIKVVLSTLASWAGTAFRAAWGLIKEYILGPLRTAWVGIQIVWALIKAGFNAAIRWLVGVFKRDWALIKPYILGPLQAAWVGIQVVWGLIKGGFNAALGFLKNVFKRDWALIKKYIVDPITAAYKVVAGIMGTAKGSIRSAFSQAVTAIGKIWGKLGDLAKVPIKFIVNTVLNDGLIGAFNWIAGKFGAPTIPTIPLPKGFAEGGRIPGRPSSTDNTYGMARGGAVPLATGEYIVNAKQTGRYLPLLEAINGGKGFALGGLFGKLKDAAQKGITAGKNFVGDAADFLADPVKWLANKFAGPLARLSELGDSAVGKIVTAVPRKIGSTIATGAKDLFAGLTGGDGGGGGRINPGLGSALAWARSQVGKPYIWGGVGPAGYDCSGFMSAITNVILGRSPYSRIGATGSMPWSMFDKGMGAFSVGWFQGNPGHTAGTLNGVNVESRGGQGVVVGSSARGATNSLFSSGPWHLRGYAKGGLMQLPGDPPYDGFNQWYKRATRFDTGGRWAPNTMGWNGSGHTETVVPHGGVMIVRLSDDDRALLRAVADRPVELDGRALNSGLSRKALGEGYGRR